MMKRCAASNCDELGDNMCCFDCTTQCIDSCKDVRSTEQDCESFYEVPAIVVNLGKEDYDVCIDRGTVWGNPYRIGVDGTRGQVLAMYRRWVQTQPQLMRKLHTLKGKRLGCNCKPAQCHGDVLVDLMRGIKITSIKGKVFEVFLGDRYQELETGRVYLLMCVDGNDGEFMCPECDGTVWKDLTWNFDEAFRRLLHE